MSREVKEPKEQLLHQAGAAYADIYLRVVHSRLSSQIGDLSFDLAHRRHPFGKPLSVILTPHVTVVECDPTPKMFNVRSANAGGAYPALYHALYGAMRSWSKEFEKVTKPCQKKDSPNYTGLPLPNAAIMTLPDDNEPRHQQAVMEITPEQVQFYTQMVIGDRANGDHAAEWQICRSPILTLERGNLTGVWHSIVQAIIYESTQICDRLEHRRPFHTVLTENPNTEWVCGT